MCVRNPLHCILPPHVLHKLAESEDGKTRTAALETLALDHKIRLARAEAAARTGGRRTQTVTFARIGGRVQRTIYDQEHNRDQTPGRVGRAGGQDSGDDEGGNQADEGVGAPHEYYWANFKRDSIHGPGGPLMG